MDNYKIMDLNTSTSTSTSTTIIKQQPKKSTTTTTAAITDKQNTITSDNRITSNNILTTITHMEENTVGGDQNNVKPTQNRNSQNIQQQQQKQQMNNENTINNTIENSKMNGKISRNQNEISPGGTLPNASNNIGITNNSAKTDNKNNEHSNNVNKRKKSKSRSSSTNKEKQQQQQQQQLNTDLQKNHLDAWLETCLKDSNTPQLSSSSEFLDYNTSSFSGNNTATSNRNKDTKSYQQQQQQQQQQPQFFIKPSIYNSPYSQGFQKTVTDYRNIAPNSHYFNSLLKNSHAMINNEASCDFASLPPIVNLSTTGENIVIDGNFDASDPNRRFSDPCLINPSDHEGSKLSGQNTPSLNPEQDNLSNQNNNNNSNNMSNQKLFLTLMEQINLLHETNSKICRNLHDTKSVYTPGMMTDVVREVKEAARVREDALLSRVKSMVEERSWSLGESNLRMMRDIEELKAQIQHLKGDRKEANKRITQLEAENKYMKQVLGSLLNSRTNEIIQENELSRSTPLQRRSTSAILTENVRPKRNSFNLHYNVLNHHDETLSSISSPNECKSPSFQRTSNNPRNANVPQFNGQLRITENFYPNAQDNEILNSDNDQQVLQMEKDTLELRRELQEALASKKDAENRIIALEKVVKKFHLNDEKHNSSVDSDKKNFNGVQQRHFMNGTSSRHNSSNGGIHNTANVGDYSSTQNQNTITHITSQMQGNSSKLSLAGPITDL
ncbi:putative uncharacterized protein DDB_G0282133 isoform X2 [Condylostylus longicornis]|uniref:putative uncharacterized protein DDB_G0282133 isoform X2 n=1 Tax=Condylostylus longicornis TaxID=2530218 RepID=UPI00244DED06|nr:putative uncharacterized protein DDB_G0282133 isoform X2 [Condylostylus longicornis]